MQLEELVANVDEEALLLIRDYVKDPEQQEASEIAESLQQMHNDELLDGHNIVRSLGYPNTSTVMDEPIAPRGYRMLHRIPRLPSMIVANLVERFEYLPHILMATIEELDEVDGIGEVRARAIKEGLKRIQDQVLIDSHI